MLSKFVGKFRRFFAFDELLKQLIIRDVKLKYRRSYLGYLWSILNPLMLMMVLVVIFSNLFRFDIPNFPLYLISGQFLFNFMTEATNMSVASITGNASLIKKTYFHHIQSWKLTSKFTFLAWCVIASYGFY
mgnify:CR=1 FL=1